MILCENTFLEGFRNIKMFKKFFIVPFNSFVPIIAPLKNL